MAEVNMESLKRVTPTSDDQKTSSRSREHLAPVVGKDGVVSTKKSLFGRIAESFLPEDTAEFKRWLIWDRIIPGVQKMILDGIQMIWFHEVRRDSGRGYYEYDRGRRNDYASYYGGSSYYGERSRDRRNSYRERNKKFDPRNVRLRTRRDAEDVVDALRNRIKDCGSVSVAEFADLIRVSSDYTDNNWGWDDARDIGLQQVSNGFLIDVTEPICLK